MTHNKKTNKIILLLVFVVMGFCAKSQATLTGPYINFPDSVFLKKLIAKGVDKNKDGKIDTTEAQKITNLDVSGSYDTTKMIRNLSGIEYFTNIELLYCNFNLISNFDISKNIKLKSLSCSSNVLVTLDVTENINLNYLECRNNNLKSIDVTKNLNLTTLICFSNRLINLDLSKNINLTWLSCGDNLFTTFDFTNNISLKYLNIEALPFLATICVSCMSFPYCLDPYFVFFDDGSPNYKCQFCNVGFSEISFRNKMKIYPIPAENFIIIENSANSKLIISNLNGEKIKEYNINNNLYNINISYLSKGVYICNIINKDIIKHIKIIKN